MRIAVLGGSGFLGTNLVTALRAAGEHEVVTLSRSESADIQLDIRVQESLRDALASVSPQCLVNLASGGLASRNPSSWQEDLELLDVQLPVKLLDWASENSNRTLLTASSSLYQVPEESEYAKAKSRGRNLLFAKARDLGDRVPKCKILNLHNVYGADQPSDRFVAAVASALRAGETFVVQFPHRRRDFVWIDEVSASILNALNDEGGGLEEVDLGTGNALSLLEAARIIAASVDRPVDAVKPSDNLQSDVVVAAELGGTFGECVTPFEEGIRVSVDTRRGPGR